MFPPYPHSVFFARFLYAEAKYFFWAWVLCGVGLLFAISRQPFIWRREYIPLFLFWGWMLASILWSVNIYETLRWGTYGSLSFLTMFFMSQCFWKEKHLRKMAWSLLLAWVAVILISFLETAHWIAIDAPFRNASTLANYTFIVHVCLMALPFLPLLYVGAKTIQEKGAALGVCAVFLSWLLLNGGDSTLLKIVLPWDLFLMLLVYMGRKSFRLKWATFVLGICLFLAGGGYFFIETYRNISPQNAFSSHQQRWIIWTNTLKAAADTPLVGTGWGTFPLVYFKYEDEKDRTLFPKDSDTQWSSFPRFAHNDWLQIFQELGLIGFVCIVAFMWAIFLALRRSEVPLSFWLSMALSNFVWISLFHFPLSEPAAVFLFSVVVGMTLSHVGSRCVRRIPLPVMPVGVVFLLVLSVQSTRYCFSQWYLKNAMASTQNLGESIARVEKALSWEKTNWQSLAEIGYYCLNMAAYEDARMLFKKAHRLCPKSPLVTYNLAIAEEGMGNKEGAMAYYKEILIEAPDFSPAQKRLSILFPQLNHP